MSKNTQFLLNILNVSGHTLTDGNRVMLQTDDKGLIYLNNQPMLNANQAREVSN